MSNGGISERYDLRERAQHLRLVQILAFVKRKQSEFIWAAGLPASLKTGAVFSTSSFPFTGLGTLCPFGSELPRDNSLNYLQLSGVFKPSLAAA